MSDNDLDIKIELLFGLVTEELRTLRDLVTIRFNRDRERLDDHEQRIAALEAKDAR